jgi:type IV pilus assembly protein PilA
LKGLGNVDMGAQTTTLQSNKERLKTMKSTFTAKYLQHLVSKKKNNEGFTLIELLVVIIIVGVLAAIALPSFLNQIGKARGSEGKAAIGTINRAQQAYRLESNIFANTITRLDAKVTGKFYTYAVAGTTTDTFASATATTTQKDVKGYGGGVSQNGDEFRQVVCETNAISTTGGNITVSAIAAAATPACNTADKNVD